MTSVFSWQNSISLCPASFCIPRPNLPVTPGVSWLPTFAFQSPIMKRTSFGVLVLKGLVGLHRTVQLQLLPHYWLGLVLQGDPTSPFSWQNSISLCPASFHIPRPNFPVTPGVSWLPSFAFQSPRMKKTSFGVLVLKGLVGLHRTVQLQLLQCYLLGHRLGLPWHWMVCLGNEQRSFCCFWDCTQVLHFGLFCWLWWLLHFF